MTISNPKPSISDNNAVLIESSVENQPPLTELIIDFIEHLEIEKVARKKPLTTTVVISSVSKTLPW